MLLKTSFLLLGIALSSLALAATIQIVPGETIHIDADEASTISCSAEGGNSQANCQLKVANLKERLNSCGYSNSSSWCVQTIWPSWKQNNPNCIDEGILTCQSFCSYSNSSAWCVQTCM